MLMIIFDLLEINFYKQEDKLMKTEGVISSPIYITLINVKSTVRKKFAYLVIYYL